MSYESQKVVYLSSFLSAQSNYPRLRNTSFNNNSQLLHHLVIVGNQSTGSHIK